MRVKIRRLEQHILRRVVNLCIEPAHHASQRDALFGIGNEQMIFGQLMLGFVERGEFFAGSCAPHHHRWFAIRLGQQMQIKGVQRLAGFHHHEIGDIDHVADRSDAHLLQARLEPIRAGADFHVANDAGVVARAQIRIINLHGHKVVCLFIESRQRNLRELERIAG